jgi:hypothetical protein
VTRTIEHAGASLTVTSFTKTEHPSRHPVVKLYTDDGRRAASISLPVAKVDELIEALVEARWSAEETQV